MMKAVSESWVTLRDEILELADAPCVDIRNDLFEIATAQLVMEQQESASRSLRIAVYRHLDNGHSEAKILEFCDRFIESTRVSSMRSFRNNEIAEAIATTVSAICREVAAVIYLSAVERAAARRENILKLEGR